LSNLEHKKNDDKEKTAPAGKTEKKKRQRKFMTIFANGKQQLVKCQPTVVGIDVEEFVRRNADPEWMQNGFQDARGRK
jgi:hypothetical protein